MIKNIIILVMVGLISACSNYPSKTSSNNLHTPFLKGLATKPKIANPLVSIRVPHSKHPKVLAKTENSFLNEILANQAESKKPISRKNSDSSSSSYIKRGLASWYGPGFHGKKTATGEVFNMYQMTAAHRTLPIPSYAEVINLKNHKSVIVRINDRGPFVKHRLLDLSYAAARQIGLHSQGTGNVEIRALAMQPYAQVTKTVKKS